MLFNKKRRRPQQPELQDQLRGCPRRGPPRGAGCARLCPSCPLAPKGHRARFCPLPSAAPGHFSEHSDYSVLSGGLSGSCLSSGNEESHSTSAGATPQITAGNKATQGLILFDETRAGVRQHFSATIQCYLCSGCHQSYLCAVHTC